MNPSWLKRLSPGAGIVAAGLLLSEAGARMAAALNIRLLGDFFHGAAAGGMLRLYDFLVAGGLSRGSVLALGVMPYISARIFVWLACTSAPAIRAMENNPAGRRALTRWTRGLTVGLAFAQSYGYARFLQGLPGAVSNPGAGFIMETVLVLTASSVFTMWLAERATERDDGQQPAPVQALRDADQAFVAPRADAEFAVSNTPRP
jgi:preprotein translocase subunit SecY